MFLPVYRGFVVAAALICLAAWFCIERTRLGALLRAATENPFPAQSFGVNVPLLVAFTFAGGVGLAALAGVLYAVNPQMGADLINAVFAVVAIGGAILTGSPSAPSGSWRTGWMSASDPSFKLARVRPGPRRIGA